MIDQNSIRLNDKLDIYTQKGLFSGIVVDILIANVAPATDKVRLYYQQDETWQYFKSICRPLPVDRIIIQNTDKKYFVLPVTNKTDRYLLDIRRIQ